MEILELLENINWGLIVPLLVVQFILLLIALIDLVRIEKTNGPKWLWALIVLFGSMIGPILYFIIGRRNE